MAYPDNRSRAVCVLVQRVCRRHHSGKLVSSPLRLSQLLALMPVAEGISARGITLPTWVGLEAQGVERVCASLEASLSTCSGR